MATITDLDTAEIIMSRCPYGIGLLGDGLCIEGHVVCECGKHVAHPLSERGYCAECEWIEAVDEMNAEGFSMERQAVVAMWRTRLDKASK